MAYDWCAISVVSQTRNPFNYDTDAHMDTNVPVAVLIR